MSPWCLQLRPPDTVDDFFTRILGNRGPLFRYAIMGLISPFLLLSLLGYILCVIIFPTFFISAGWQISGGSPGVVWAVWSLLVVAYYSLTCLVVVLQIADALRSRVIPLLSILQLTLFILGFGVLIAWFNWVVMKV